MGLMYKPELNNSLFLSNLSVYRQTKCSIGLNQIICTQNQKLRMKDFTGKTK